MKNFVGQRHAFADVIMLGDRSKIDFGTDLGTILETSLFLISCETFGFDFFFGDF